MSLASKSRRREEHLARRQIRSMGLPFIETSRGRCEQCDHDHDPEGPRRFRRVWFAPLSPRAPRIGSLYTGKRRCAPCTMRMAPEDLS